MHYYQFHIGDYRASTAHLSNEEDLAYRRLLDMYYDTEVEIPLDTHWVARRLRIKAGVIQQVLEDMFTRTEAGWSHLRCADEINRYHQLIDRNRVNGGKGGRPKKPTGFPVGSQSQPNGNPVETNWKANQEPITNNSSVPNGTGGKPPLTPDEIIFGYGVPMLTTAGIPEKQARSFLGGLRKGHGDESLIDALRECIKVKPLQPLEWLSAALPPKGRRKTKQENFETKNYEGGLI